MIKNKITMNFIKQIEIKNKAKFENKDPLID